MAYYLKWLHFDSKLNKHVFKCVGLENYSLFKCNESEIHKYFVSNRNEIVFQEKENETKSDDNNELSYNYRFLNRPIKSDTVPLSFLLQQ